MTTNDPLRARLAGDEPAFGIWLNDPELVEVAAMAGLDWFFVDLMYTSNDWSRVSELLTAGAAYGITPVVRVQSNPWLGEDPRIAVDVSRLQGIGTRYIVVSYAGMNDLAPCLDLARDWHRKPFVALQDEAVSAMAPEREQTTIIPMAETADTLAGLPKILSVPGVRIVWVAMNDASRILSDPGPPNWYAPKLWDLIDALVAGAKSRDAVICANAGPAASLGELEARLAYMVRRGVRMIMAQGTTLLLRLVLQEVLEAARKKAREVGEDR